MYNLPIIKESLYTLYLFSVLVTFIPGTTLAQPYPIVAKLIEDTYVDNTISGQNQINNSFGDENHISMQDIGSRKFGLIRFDTPSCFTGQLLPSSELYLNVSGEEDRMALEVRKMPMVWDDDSSWADVFGPFDSTIPDEQEVLDSTGIDAGSFGIYSVDNSLNYLIAHNPGPGSVSIPSLEALPAHSHHHLRSYVVGYYDGIVVGDSNDDGKFDSGDIATVFRAGKYETNEPATYEEGDWNFDCVFDSSDIVYAVTHGDYS